MKAQIEVRRDDGSVVIIKRKLAEGGQGIVYIVADESDERQKLAKIYKYPSYLQARRLTELIRRRNDRLERVAAWPIGLIYDPDGNPIGFEMPQVVNGVPLYAAYQIRSRLSKFPGRDYKFLVRAARNLAAAIHHVHEAGLVVGDLNESNVLVDGEAMVKLIDTDSYQIEVEGDILTCDVGKSELIAPELQGRSLAKLVRTPDHDRFSLSVLLFHLLVLGRHPFAGTPKGKDDVTLEDAMLNGWYPYESDRGGPLLPPPGLTIQWMQPAIRDLFRQSFDPIAEGQRPTAEEWFGALKELEDGLVTCLENPRHLYPGTACGCPWCALERQWSVSLFGALNRPEPLEELDDDDDFDVDEAWKAILAVPRPVTSAKPALVEFSDLPSFTVPLSERATFYSAAITLPLLASASLMWAGIQVGAIVVLWGVIFRVPIAWLCGIGPKVRRSRRMYIETKQRLAEVLAEWERDVSPKPFDEAIESFDDMRRRYKDLKSVADRLRIQALTREHGPELIAYLSRFPITTADVASLSNSQAFHLDNVGIRTAVDVTPESLERQCPTELRNELLTWRRSLELHFWNTSMYVPSPAAERRIRQEIGRERAAIRAALTNGPATLDQMRESMAAHQEALLQRLAALTPQYEEAGARHKAYSQLVGRTQ